MGNCHSCALPVPDGQNVCSMCYGDPHYGSDGYMMREMERAEMEHRQNEEYEQAMYEDYLNQEDKNDNT